MLPFFKSEVTELDLMQTKWASELNPLLSKALLKGRQIDDVALEAGDNVVDHKLGRQPQGWFVVDSNAHETVYRTAWDSLTLTLNASGAVTVSIYVY